MGTRTIPVGCPHRLRSPIGPNTRIPCDWCVITFRGWPPGWPRYAWAITVDRGPRLAQAAASAPRPVAAPAAVRPGWRAAATPEVLTQASDALQKALGRVAVELGAAIQTSGVVIQQVAQTTEDQMLNRLRFEAAQEVRSRMLHGR